MSPKSTCTEEELFQLIRNKDQEAFSYLYDRYSAPLYGVICRLVNDDQQANDILEKAFLAIWNNCSAGSIKGKLFVYMHNIARDIAMKEMTKPVYVEKINAPSLNYTVTQTQAYGF